MLRASSLGLSFPSAAIFTLQQCRRLYGVRRRLDLARHGRNTVPAASIAFQSTLPSQRHEQDADGRRRDVATISVSQIVGEDCTACTLPDLSDTVEETSMSTSPGPTIAVDDPSHREESQSKQFFALIEEEFNAACIPFNILSVPKWIPPAAGQTHKSKIPIKPVEISNSLHVPLTLLISKLRDGHQPAIYSESTREGRTPTEVPFAKMDTDAGVNRLATAGLAAEFGSENLEDHLPDSLPPRDTAAQIWKHLHILGTTASSDEAWNAYVYLLDTISEYPLVHAHVPQIPFSHLHRFCRVLSRTRPKTHRQYLRLLSVMTYMKQLGGNLNQFEMNALIDLAGKGRRNIQPEALEKQLSVFNDLRAGQLPGVSVYAPEEWQQLVGPAFEPDVSTLTSMINSAARGGATATLRELVMLMNKSGIAPNRVTHIALLKYYVNKEDIAGLRATLQRMRQLDLNLGVEGLNACMHAYSKFNKLTVVFMIYRLLRHNIIPEEYRGANDIYEASARLEEEFIFVEEDNRPDEITYTLAIQIMAYHGQFRATMEVFLDMLSRTHPESTSSESDSPLHTPCNPDEQLSPTLAVYRGIFIGFCKHAVPPYEVARRRAKDWTLANLREIFQRFLTLPLELELTQAELWTVMYAFARTSDWDLSEMRAVWLAIDKRFGIKLLRPHGNSALVRLKRRLFPDD